MPPTNLATMEASPSTLISQPGARLIPRREPLTNSPPAETATARPTQKAQPTKGKSREKDYESAEDTNSSSEEVRETQRDGNNLAGPGGKEPFIRQQLEGLEYTLRSKEQNRPHPSGKTVTYTRPEIPSEYGRRAPEAKEQDHPQCLDSAQAPAEPFLPRDIGGSTPGELQANPP